jgi:hypothetical protein
MITSSVIEVGAKNYELPISRVWAPREVSIKARFRWQTRLCQMVKEKEAFQIYGKVGRGMEIEMCHFFIFTTIY